jgi:PAS domain S-box-containing protein
MSHPAKILLVDDDSVILKATRLTLEANGYEVSTAADGAEGLRLAAASLPDLALLDRMLPDIDGIEVCRRLKADPATARVFVVLVSAIKTSGNDRSDGLETGADDYIVRPISNRELLARVQALLCIKHAEEKIRYQADLLANVSDAVISTDLDFVIRTWNRAAESMYGWREAEVIGKTVNEVLHTEFPADDEERVLQQFLSEGVWKGEVIQRRKDGTPIPILASVSFIRDGAGNPTGVVAVNRNITERKQAEEEIRRRVNELEAVHKVSIALRAAQSTEEALPVLLDETLAALQSEAGIIWLNEPARGELRTAAVRGWFRELAESPIQPGEGIAGTVFSSGQTHVSIEFASDPLARASVRERIPPGWGGACVAIHAAAVVIGVMFVSVRAPRQMTAAEVKALEALAEIAGTTLHRLRLHDEALRRVQQLQALQTIERAITSVFDPQITLNVLLEQMLASLGADAAGVLLFNPHALTLEYAAGRGFRGHGYERSRLRLGEGLAGFAALERRTIAVADIAQCEPPFVRLPLLAGDGLVSYAVTPLIAKGQLLGMLETFHRTSFEHSDDWLSFLETLANQAAIAIDNARLFEGLQRSNIQLSLAYDATIEGWSRALDLSDKETEGHALRVADMTLKLAGTAGMREEELAHVRRGALLHDIGKMGIPDAILLKPDKLTDEEWAITRQHPTLAYNMLSPITYLHPALDIPYCHHEKWDGTGYPRGLKGEQIPLAARLFAVVNVWDALRSDRPYRPAWPEDKALEYIRSQAGKHFDPATVELFFQVINENTQEHK